MDELDDPAREEVSRQQYEMDIRFMKIWTQQLSDDYFDELTDARIHYFLKDGV